MSGIDYLFYASAAVWLGLGAYISFLAFRQRDLARRLSNMEDNAHVR
jgi:CcmD family protein